MSNTILVNSVFVPGKSGDISIASVGNINYEELAELLEKVLVESENKDERVLASEAKKLCNNNDKGKLKALIKENQGTFLSDTFSTLVGGGLLEILKGLI